jgi:predicted unusual protein kinase regulating ubiquinone biosynthesis (AarF/ABC1/UbiB family)
LTAIYKNQVGQALSARTDLLPAKYAKGLTGLQDAVPPFSADLGRKVIEQELGIQIDNVFSYLSPEPVAAASIGQVYKGVLRSTGQEVAVKVQRPQVLQNVALDLHLMRSIAPRWQKLKEMNTNLTGLVDAWGTGFINELDYRKEAKATTEFSMAMKERGLGSVFAPEVISELSSKYVLTTKWVDGQRLVDSDAIDVPRLCAVALNAYLTMMLDTGCLHCDPHPGNLLRTPDGRLCILDWGMTLDVPQDLQLSLLEFIANLNAENYEEVPNDLVKLQFVPADKLTELRQSGLTVAISNMLKLAGEGGGPKGAMQRMVAQNKEKYAEALKDFDDLDSPEATALRQKLFREDWQRQMAEDALSRSDNPQMSATMDLTTKIEQMQEQNSDVFAIPDYFVYMSRAFATLEGISLSFDSNYSITKECFPYLAKRLISDDSPRARDALKMLLYGKGNDLNLQKLQEVTNGLESYTTSTSSVESSRGMSNEGRNAAIEQLANVLLSENGNYVQELLLRESALALDTTIRNSILSPLEPVRNAVFVSTPLPLRPFTLPLELVKSTLDLQALDERDHKRLENMRILTDLINAGRSNSSNTQQEFGGISPGNNNLPFGKLIEEASKRRQALARVGLRFGGSLVNVQAERLRERSGKSELTKQLAWSSAETLDALAEVISNLDRNLSKR